MQVARFECRLFLRTVLSILLAGSASAQWPQWGGPNRDFLSPATGLAEEWPEGGPRKIWERDLGAGYSSIVSDGGRLFTLYRSGDDEVVVALDARTGATVWEHRYRSSPGNEAPNSTPTVAGDRLYTLGVSGVLCALEKSSGKLAWSHDLVKEYGAKWPDYGFSASPLVHAGSLILPVGGSGYGVAAFALADGELLWHAHDFENVYASPIRIEVEGEVQVAVLAADRIVGLDPETGGLLWSEPIANEGGMNIATPIWCSDALLCVTAGTSGSIGLRFSKVDGETRVEKAWANDAQIAQTTVVRVGDLFYGSTGHDPFFVTAIDARTGEVAWQEPGFSLANLAWADGKIVLLDAEGVLALATAGPEDWKVKSKMTVLAAQAFTPPTISDTSLYLRDLTSIVAIDLGRPK
jgi:outer membrane protein assembly factor BamB